MASKGRNLSKLEVTETGGVAAEALTSILDAAPEQLNTLNELAAALGDDSNFSATVTNSLATKVSKTGDTMTGQLIVDLGDSTELTNSAIKVQGYSSAIELMDKDNVQNWFIGVDDNDLNAFNISRGYGPGQNLATHLQLYPGDSTTWKTVFNSTTGPAVTIDGNGLFGIGQSSPAYNIDIGGSGTVTQRIKGNGAGYTNSCILLEASDTGRGLGTYYYSGATGEGYEWYAGLPYASGTINGADNFRIMRQSSPTTKGQDTAAGSTFLKIDSTGRVTTPNQPQFMVRGDTSAWHSAAGDVHLNFFSLDSGGDWFNVGGHWANSRFTAPVAGTYLIGYGIYHRNDSGYDDDTNHQYFRFKRNGSWFASTNNHIMHYTNNGDGDNTFTGSLLAKLSAGDYIEPWNANADSGSYYKAGCVIFGYLLG